MDTGRFEEQPFLATRNATVDFVELGRQRHLIPVFFEADVTRARARLSAAKARTGERPSFTAWVVKCTAQAVSEHKRVHAMRRGRRRLVLFDDVDVSITVERRPPGRSETIPMPYVLRRANEKSLPELQREVRSAQRQPVEAGESQLGVSGRGRWMRLFFALPGPVRRTLLRRTLLADPFRAKRAMGTVIVTSAGLPGGRGSAWGVPLGLHPLTVAVGNVVQKPAVVAGRVEPRELVTLTVLFDHDVVDGAPVARFVARLQALLEDAWGLEPAGEAPDAGRS